MDYDPLPSPWPAEHSSRFSTMSYQKRTTTDAYPTDTTNEQGRVEKILEAHRPPSDQPKPRLQHNDHLQYLLRNFVQGFPVRFISQDASQPWLHFWTLQSFLLLGVVLDPDNKQRAIDTIMASQHPNGGFGGGPGQAPHLLPTYAAVSALAIVGRPGPGGGWDEIDRDKLYAFYMSLKQPDGSFLVAHDQEVDVRGIYCLLCVAVFLNILTPELIAGTPAFLASLQTYEGGFASASQPYFAPLGSALSSTPTSTSRRLLPYPRPALGEAHGGYTFCALASWVMLRPFHQFLPVEPGSERRPEINVRRLVRWLTNMQGSPRELGGFRGRTNKLVDACYSWWVGGAFALLRPLGVTVRPPVQDKTYEGREDVSEEGEGPWSEFDDRNRRTHYRTSHKSDGKADDHTANRGENEESWSDMDDSLFDRLGLQEYILYAGQHKAGGLRDKPPKISDSYHTLYALAGLSSAQHHVFQVPETMEKLKRDWKPTGVEPALDEMRKIAFAEARSWTEEEGTSIYVNGKADRVNATHPVLNLTMTTVRNVMNHFYGQG